MHFEILVLRLIHILGGIFWLGAGLFTTFFLAPALATQGATAGQVMAALQQRRLFTAMPLAALLVILSGLRLLWIASAGSPAYFQSPSGRAFSLSGGLAIVAFVLALLIVRPSNVRAGELSAALASASPAEHPALAAQVGALRRRGGITGMVATICLVLSAAGMSVARYLQ